MSTPFLSERQQEFIQPLITEAKSLYCPELTEDKTELIWQSPSSQDVRTIMEMLKHPNGKALSGSEVGCTLGVTGRTVRKFKKGSGFSSIPYLPWREVCLELCRQENIN